MKSYIIFLVFLISSKILFAQTTDAIIEDHIKAIGELSKWEKIKTIQIEGEVQEEGNLITSKFIAVKNQSYRKDINIKGRNLESKAQTYYTIVTPNGGWSLAYPNLKPYTMDSTSIQLAMDDLDYEDPFINYQQKGRTIRLEGIEHYYDQDHYKFSITFASQKMIYCYMNATSLMIEKTILLNAPVEDIKKFSNYVKLPEGIIIAKEIKSNFGTLKLGVIKINTEISKNAFEPNVIK